jgi:hypothetical protein
MGQLRGGAESGGGEVESDMSVQDILRGRSIMNLLLSLVRGLGNAVRNTVYVTVDALRGRYDH